MANFRDHFGSSRHDLAVGWTSQNGKVEWYMHFRCRCRALKESNEDIFGAACSDVNKTDSKDKMEKCRAFRTGTYKNKEALAIA